MAATKRFHIIVDLLLLLIISTVTAWDDDMNGEPTFSKHVYLNMINLIKR